MSIKTELRIAAEQKRENILLTFFTAGSFYLLTRGDYFAKSKYPKIVDPSLFYFLNLHPSASYLSNPKISRICDIIIIINTIQEPTANPAAQKRIKFETQL